MTKAQDRSGSAEEQNMINSTASSGRRNDQPAPENARLARIRELNDRLRTTGRGGMVVMTNGVGAFGLETVQSIFAAIASFTDFSPDNDPWCEHDFGSLTVEGVRLFWKIDYYDRSRRIHSPDPADPKVTVRVLTVMLAEEY